VQFIVAMAAMTLTLLLFQDHPPTPPTVSAKTMQMNKKSNQMFIEVTNLFQNTEYVKLFCAFTIILGSLNSLAALLNQLPGDYSNSEIGLTGAALIMSGFFGAFMTGFVLDYSKAYSTVLKVAYFLAAICWVFFLANCRNGNLALFVVSGAFLGFFTLPTSKLILSFLFIYYYCKKVHVYEKYSFAPQIFIILLSIVIYYFCVLSICLFIYCIVPATIVSTVECSYPIPEDASVGFLYIGANLMAIPMTFLGTYKTYGDTIMLAGILHKLIRFNYLFLMTALISHINNSTFIFSCDAFFE